MQRQVLPGKEVHCKIPAKGVPLVMDMFAHIPPFIEKYMLLTRPNVILSGIDGFLVAVMRK